MDTVVKRKNWFKRLFILDYDVQLAPLLESIDPILENIQIQQIEIDDAHLKIDGLSEAIKVVVRQVESVDEKLNLIKTFDYQGKILYAQADLDMNASGNSDIAVSIDNINKAAYLRFGSSEAVDTVNAVWFISKTGNKVKNDFGDELSPSAPRLTVQNFLRMTQEKQGDVPLTDLVPPHTHDVYQGEIEDLDARVEILESSASGEAFDDSELKKGIAENSAGIAVNTTEIAVNTAGIESNSAAIAVNYVRCEENELKTIENAFQIALVNVRVDDIEEFLGGVYFEVSLGVDRWIFDTGSAPGEGNFTALTYDFSAANTEYLINEFAAGSQINNWEDARPGDKFNVTAQNNGDTNYGKYVISTIEKSDGIWNITGDFVEGEGRLTAGLGYFIEILHGSRQFEPDEGVGGPIGHEHPPAPKQPSGRPFVFGSETQAGEFYADDSGNIYFNREDLDGIARVMNTYPDFTWSTPCKITVWNEYGQLKYACEAGKTTDYKSDTMVFKNGKLLFNKSLSYGVTYYITVEGYW